VSETSPGTPTAAAPGQADEPSAEVVAAVAEAIGTHMILRESPTQIAVAALRAAVVAQQPQREPAGAGRPTTSLEDALLANIDGLNDLVRDMLQSFPDTADEQEWRDRAGALGVCDPDGQPYRSYTEDDL